MSSNPPSSSCAKSSVVCIKIGSSTLVSRTDEKETLAVERIQRIVKVTSTLVKKGYRVVLISSGAVSAASRKFGKRVYPKTLHKKQALASIGQALLMRQYDDLFSAEDIVCAQILLTFDNMRERGQYLNVVNTFTELFKMGVVPIVNENDAVAVEELRFGDNDRLAAMVANLLAADWLFMLSDVNGLYDTNPNTNPDAKPIRRVSSFSSLQADVKLEGGTQFSTGGMSTKIQAAHYCSSCGIHSMVLHGEQPENVLRVLEGSRENYGETDFGTYFVPTSEPIRGVRRWILGLEIMGTLTVDDGAQKAINAKNSLFCAGVTRVEGDFRAADCVRVCASDGSELARGIVDYSSTEMRLIKGKQSSEIAEILGFQGDMHCCHRARILLSSRLRAGSSGGDEGVGGDHDESCCNGGGDGGAGGDVGD